MLWTTMMEEEHRCGQEKWEIRPMSLSQSDIEIGIQVRKKIIYNSKISHERRRLW